MTTFNAWTRDLGATQGRIEPSGWTPPDGSWVLCLGRDAAGHSETLAAGDYVEAAQTGDFGDGKTLRFSARLRPPSANGLPDNVWWRASVLLDQAEIVGWTIEPNHPRSLENVGFSLGNLSGNHTVTFRLELQGREGTYEVELPAFYVDAIVLDPSTTTPSLLNLDPQPDDVEVPADGSITLDLCDATDEGIDLSNTTISVNGVAAFRAGSFQTGFTGPASATVDVKADTTRIIVDPLATFANEATVTVRVQTQTLHTASALDTSYTFTVERLVGPTVESALSVDAFTVRVAWDEPVVQVNASGASDALNPANYAIARTVGETAVNVAVVGVTAIDDQTIDLTTDIAVTPLASYTVTVTGVRDLEGNESASPTNASSFTGWQPPIPAGRDFDLLTMLGQKALDDDATGDLQGFVSILQEVTNFGLSTIDAFTDIINPDVAEQQFVEAMLDDLGNPFADFDLDLIDERRLVHLLVAIYQQKGTNVGIINAVRFFIGVTITIDDQSPFGSWILGASQIGEGTGTTLGTYDARTRNTFWITSSTSLTEDQATKIAKIAAYMKRGTSHVGPILQPGSIAPYNPVELGVSRLGVDWTLH